MNLVRRKSFSVPSHSANWSAANSWTRLARPILGPSSFFWCGHKCRYGVSTLTRITMGPDGSHRWIGEKWSCAKFQGRGYRSCGAKSRSFFLLGKIQARVFSWFRRPLHITFTQCLFWACLDGNCHRPWFCWCSWLLGARRSSMM